MSDADAGTLRAAGIPARVVARRILNCGKTLLRLESDAGVVKLARHPVGRSLLRAEAAAYAAPPPAPPYVRAELVAYHDADDATLLWLERLHGTGLSRWRSLQALPGPFECQATGKMDLPGLLPEADTPWTAGWRSRVATRWPDQTITAGPSHGDFVYWNLMSLSGGRLGLLDYEHYEAVAPIGADRLFWRLTPLCRIAARHGWAGLPYHLVRRLAPPVEVAVVLLRHGHRLSREDSLPGATTLYDRATVDIRRRLMALYSQLLDRLLE